MEKRFYTAWDRPEKVLEKGGGPSLTEAAGYIPAEVQIRQLMEAGERLDRARAEAYQYGPGEADDGDPAIPPGYDLSDAYRDLESGKRELARIQAVIEEAEKARAAAVAAEPKEKAPE